MAAILYCQFVKSILRRKLVERLARRVVQVEPEQARAVNKCAKPELRRILDFDKNRFAHHGIQFVRRAIETCST
jgi:hypothetical protein